ncbi:centromere protein Chl4/mis15/CENP-N [Coniella lustricola]|uniref:Centromere protein Chl4/mis15/CENP-N n=1 Tax=Coniella lustricola TaxID=2025994 RepID=A0A2T3AJ58_9PEZI|nr:centromere protein Chl4/mis15/CENP-N [Coniella lustricola]
MARVSIPTTGCLPHTLRLDPSNPAIIKVLNRLTRPSLLTVVLEWLDEANTLLCVPYLRNAEDEDEDDDPADLYPPETSLEDLRNLYTEMQTRKGSKREVIDRICDGDWRHGLTLYQLSMADLQHLYDHPTSLQWSAYGVAPLRTPTSQQAAEGDRPLKVDAKSLVVPRFHPSTFLQNLQAQVLPDVKAHYNIDRPKDMALLLLRIFMLDSPYRTDLATTADAGMGGRGSANAADASRTIYIAFPDGAPYVYISKSQSIGPSTASETKSLRALVVEGIPKAFSRPRERYTLKRTQMTTRNLHGLLHRRGPGRTNTAGGGWSIYSDERAKESPLDVILPTPPLSEEDEQTAAFKKSSEGRKRDKDVGRRKRFASPETQEDERRQKRSRLVAQARFGDSARADDGRGVERVDIVINDSFLARGSTRKHEAADGARLKPAKDVSSDPGLRTEGDGSEGSEGEGDDDNGDGGSQRWRPSVKLTFHGSHVFAGIRQLVEAGIIQGEKMPGWMTGEEGVTIGAVRQGRITGYHGSGI